MSARFVRPSPAAIARVRALAEQTLSRQELVDRLAWPVTEDEREETVALIRWFRRRYPTPGERLRYARRKWVEWTRIHPLPGDENA